MSAALTCLVQEESGWALLLLSVVALALIGFCAGVLWWLLRELALNLKAGRSLGGVEFHVWGKKFAAQNLGMLLLVVGVVLAIPVGIGILIILGYNEISTLHHVEFNVPSVKISLEQVRQEYQGDTSLTILLAPEVKNFEIDGHFSGECVADLFQSICRRYPDILLCSTSWQERTISVRALGSP